MPAIPSPSRSRYREKQERFQMKWWHGFIIDDCMANPNSTEAERAKRLGYSENYLVLIMNTDMFKAALEDRRRAFTDRLNTSILEKTAAVAVKTLDIMAETLDSKRGAIPFALLNETLDNTLSKLGYGGKAAAPAVQINAPGSQVAVVSSVTPEQLAEARRSLQAAETLRAVEPPAPPSGGGGPPTLSLTPNREES